VLKRGQRTHSEDLTAANPSFREAMIGVSYAGAGGRGSKLDQDGKGIMFVLRAPRIAARDAYRPQLHPAPLNWRCFRLKRLSFDERSLVHAEEPQELDVTTHPHLKRGCGYTSHPPLCQSQHPNYTELLIVAPIAP
jgi:hypothetical protein